MARVDLSTLDDMRLSGDEDCGVNLVCRDCDMGGQPVAYYLPHKDAWNPWAKTEVAAVDSIAGLVLAAVTHRTSVHGDARPQGL